MKIYASPISPPARMVVAVANFLELDFDYINVDILGLEHKTEAYAKLNPN